MRILGLDLGDKWTGVAVSDPTGMLCKPLKTVATAELKVFLRDFLQQNSVGIIVYGLPLNQYGLEGEQAKKTNLIANSLKEIVTTSEFSATVFVAWDERRSSRLAANSMRENRNHKKGDKSAEHAVAAAFILQNYMDFKKLEDSF